MPGQLHPKRAFDAGARAARARYGIKVAFLPALGALASAAAPHLGRVLGGMALGAATNAAAGGVTGAMGGGGLRGALQGAKSSLLPGAVMGGVGSALTRPPQLPSSVMPMAIGRV